MRRARPLLGTYVEIEADGAADAALERAVNAAFAAVGLVQHLMSFHAPDSDLSRLNREAAAGPVAVHPWTEKVLRWARRLFDASGGQFDCAVGHELMDWGLLPADGRGRAQRGTFSAVTFWPGNRISFAAPIALDLGGIAKGFAVDCAIAALRRHGVRAGVVNAGGDLRVMGELARPIHIRDPGDPARLLPAGLLRNGAIATSSPAATLKAIDGRHVSALVATATRTPVIARDAYSVAAPTCLLADALTKVVAQTGRTDAPCLARFRASAFVTSVGAMACVAA